MGHDATLLRASELATSGRLLDAKEEFVDLLECDSLPRHVVLNNLAAVEASLGQLEIAKARLKQSARFGSAGVPAQNIRFLDQFCRHGRSRRVAIVSLLFNWPSTGGGTVHTKELAQFLTAYGYQVTHFFAQYDNWAVGRIDEPLPYDSVALRFDSSDWNEEAVRSRYRRAVEAFCPDVVIVTDSWNTKPLLAEAVSAYPYYIRIAAQECLCPLNNVRLLLKENEPPVQCELHQLEHSQTCRECVSYHQSMSGELHRLERELAGFFREDYASRLQRAFEDAAGVLVVNPAIASCVSSHCANVRVVPSGFDQDRFPEVLAQPAPSRPVKRILFAGVVREYMKGFHVLQEAADHLWGQRQDFEILATADPIQLLSPHTQLVGWKSQADLPSLIHSCDILVFPTIAQEALGRTVVEAMACARPVVASNLGGLSWVVDDEQTGLLFEPSDAQDLAAKLNRLLSDEPLRIQFGNAGREKFETNFTWQQVIEQHYLPLLGSSNIVPETTDA